jgi:hypothetical protein
MDGMSDKWDRIRALRFEFNKNLMRMQDIVIELHKLGVQDVVALKQSGSSSEIYLEERN